MCWQQRFAVGGALHRPQRRRRPGSLHGAGRWRCAATQGPQWAGQQLNRMRQEAVPLRALPLLLVDFAAMPHEHRL